MATKAERALCRHKNAGLIPFGDSCSLCAAKRKVASLFATDDRYDTLRNHLFLQIDGGYYSLGTFCGAAWQQMLCELISRQEAPDHAWIDALPVPRMSREHFRQELMASAAIEPLVSEVQAVSESIHRKKQLINCAHKAGVCLECRARRNIHRVFKELPEAMRPLRQYYETQLEAKKLKPEYFQMDRRQFWRLVERIASEPNGITHHWFDLEHSSDTTVGMRRDLIACGYLPFLQSAVKCVHIDRGFISGKYGCHFCTGRRIVIKMLQPHPRLHPLQEYLVIQIDRGKIQQQTFSADAPFGRALRELCEDPNRLSHAWIDNLQMLRAHREHIREELVASSILVKRPELESDRIIAAERIVSRFEKYPHLAPLRDRFLTQLSDGFYVPDFFKAKGNKLWPIIQSLGENPTNLSHEWFGTQQSFSRRRAVRIELMACGLLKTPADHVEVDPFLLWAASYIASAKAICSDDRLIIERYVRLSCAYFARDKMNCRQDRASRVLNVLKQRVRRAVLLAQIVHKHHRTLCDFDAVHVNTFPSTQAQHIRPFIAWMRRNGYTSTTWLPQHRFLRNAYHGLKISERREAVKRMLEDETLELRQRVAGLLSYFGVTLTALAAMRASDVFVDYVTVGEEQFDLTERVGALTYRLRNELLAQTRVTRPKGWDPWLFAAHDAFEVPQCEDISGMLCDVGFKPFQMRNDGIRMVSAKPVKTWIYQSSLGRSKSTVGQHLAAMSSKANEYAAMLVNERLRPDQMI